MEQISTFWPRDWTETQPGLGVWKPRWPTVPSGPEQSPPCRASLSRVRPPLPPCGVERPGGLCDCGPLSRGPVCAARGDDTAGRLPRGPWELLSPCVPRGFCLPQHRTVAICRHLCESHRRVGVLHMVLLVLTGTKFTPLCR